MFGCPPDRPPDRPTARPARPYIPGGGASNIPWVSVLAPALGPKRAGMGPWALPGSPLGPLGFQRSPLGLYGPLGSPGAPGALVWAPAAETAPKAQEPRRLTGRFPVSKSSQAAQFPNPARPVSESSAQFPVSKSSQAAQLPNPGSCRIQASFQIYPAVSESRAGCRIRRLVAEARLPKRGSPWAHRETEQTRNAHI